MPNKFIPPVAAFDEVRVGNFGAHIIAGEATRGDIPNYSFVVYDPEQRDQIDSDLCVSFGLAMLSEQTEGSKMSGCYNFAEYKRIYKRPLDELGADIFGVLMTRSKVGIPEAKLWDYTQGNKRNYYANAVNIPKNVHDNAKLHMGKSAFQIYQPFGWDKFDTARAYLNKLRVLLSTGADGHNIEVIGYLKAGDNFKDIKALKKPLDIRFNEDKIFSKDSYDRPDNIMNYRLGVYRNGYRFFSRKEVNQFFNLYTLCDMPRELAELLNNYNNKAIKGTSEKVYLVKNGKKYWIPNEETAWAYDIYMYSVNSLTDEELNKIPEGEQLRFEDALEENRKKLNEILNSPVVLERLKNKL